MDPAALTDEQYIEHHGLRAHLTDALSLIAHAPAKVKPIEFLAQYFTLLSSPSRLLHRDFKFINSSPATRRAFVALFRRTFMQSKDTAATNAGEHGEAAVVGPTAVLNAAAVHSLCCLLCADFPFSLVRNAARITNDVPAAAPASSASAAVAAPSSASGDLTLHSFSHRLFVLFFFSEFLNACALTFRALDTAGVGRVHRGSFLSKLRETMRAKRGAFAMPDEQAIEDSLAEPSPLPSSASSRGSAESDDAIDSTGVSADDDQSGVMFNAFCVDLFAHPLVRQALETAE